MGRKRTIDRNRILDAAEAIVAELGSGRLTFDAVARRAGVSKGGVLYCFPSKQELTAAMAERDLKRFDADVATHREAFAGEAEADILAHLTATRHESAALAAKAASLLAALTEAPEHAEPIRQHYREQLRQFGGTTGDERRARLAFFAAEGAFLLRGLGIARFGKDEWARIFEELAAFVKGKC